MTRVGTWTMGLAGLVLILGLGGCESKPAKENKVKVAIVNELADKLAKITTYVGIVDAHEDLERLVARIRDQVKRIASADGSTTSDEDKEIRAATEKAVGRVDAEFARIEKTIGKDAVEQIRTITSMKNGEIPW